MAILKDVLYDPDPDGQGGTGSGNDGGNVDATVEESVVVQEEVVVEEDGESEV